MKKTTNIKALVLVLSGIELSSLSTTDALANPQDGQVVAGSATITQATPNKVDITQTTDKAIIDWNSFSINANEHTQFHQPSASSVTLNRVVGEDPSQILGRLTANGQVFLVNPNGIYFGKNAQIDVAGLVASTHNIRNEDFLAGRYNFNIPGKPGAAVINEGTINIADTGIAAFVAPSAANRGVIVAKLGRVVLAAANGFTLDFHGDELLTFLVNDEVAKTAFDLEGKQLTSFAENAGQIEAQGGYVLLTAKAAENAIHSVINQSGTIEATTVDTHNGEIILNAGKGSLSVSGTLDASAPNGGDGGFIETSGGRVAIDPATRITTAALFGKTGRWLIDPTDYTIAASGGDITGAALANYLSASNIEIQTLATGSSSGNGDIFVNDSVTWNSFNKLTLTAHRHIYVNRLIDAAGGGSVKLRASSTGGRYAVGSFLVGEDWWDAHANVLPLGLTYAGTVLFSGNGHITVNNGAAVEIYYNPVKYNDAATKSDTSGNPYSNFVTLNSSSYLNAYMLVSNVNQLQSMQSNLHGTYALSKDIDANDTVGWNSGAGFQPINGFMGIFDGTGHVINGLYINRPTTDNVGLFGLTSYDSNRPNHWDADSTIKNVGIINGTIIGQDFVGGLVGFLWYGNILNSYNTSEVHGRNYVGGLVGRSTSITNVTDSYSNGSAWGTDNVGGLAGELYNGAFARVYSGGHVSGRNNIGGLVGNIRGGTVNNAFAANSVIGIQYVGGLAGSLSNWSSITNSYSDSSVQGSLNVGGLVGFQYDYSNSVISSFWNTQFSGQATSAAGGTGLTTAQMKQQASFSGWDFTNTWQITEGVSRPTLKVASAQTVTVLKPGVSVTPPPVTLTPAQQLLVQQHQNDNPSMLLIAIGNGLFSNSPSDPVWTGMYQNGTATQAQVTANSLWPTYAIYKSATVNKVLEGLANGDIVHGDAIWTALGSSNQQNRNDAYYSFTHPTSPVPPTKSLNSFLGLDANELYAAVINNNLENSYSTSANWLALKTGNGGNATQAQITADIMLNSYNRYKTYKGQDLADKLYQDVVNQFSLGGITITNDSANLLWKGSYGGTLQAGSAQVDANIMAQSFKYYATTDKRNGYGLFADILRGSVTLPGVGQQTITNDSDNLVWRGIYGWSGGLQAAEAQKIANKMKEARDDYYQHSSRLLNAVNAGIIKADDKDDRWVALKDGWGSSTLSLSSVQRAVLDSLARQAASKDVIVVSPDVIKTQDYVVLSPWTHMGNFPNSGNDNGEVVYENTHRNQPNQGDSGADFNNSNSGNTDTDRARNNIALLDEHLEELLDYSNPMTYLYNTFASYTKQYRENGDTDALAKTFEMTDIKGGELALNNWRHFIENSGDPVNIDFVDLLANNPNIKNQLLASAAQSSNGEFVVNQSDWQDTDYKFALGGVVIAWKRLPDENVNFSFTNPYSWNLKERNPSSCSNDCTMIDGKYYEKRPSYGAYLENNKLIEEGKAKEFSMHGEITLSLAP